MSWQIVPAQTNIQFTVRHMMIRKVHGRFKRFIVAFTFDEENPAKSTVSATIDVASIYTGDKQRDSYLRSAGFLNVAHYPKLTFASKRVEQINARNGRLTGDLTIQDNIQEVTLNIRQTRAAKKSEGAASYRFQATTSINRKSWGLEWGVALEAGGWLVGDTINIDIQLEIIQTQ